MAKMFGRVVVPAVALIVGVALALGAMQFLPGLSAFRSTSESRNTQVINAIQREEQIVLLSLGIQGISERKEGRQFFGVDIPGANRAAFLQYNFKAKLGLEGADVQIEPVGENMYRIALPAFKFIGHDDVNFRMAAEENGVLSWITPEIDTVETINQILNDEAQTQYVEDHREVLEDQAMAFYSGIIRSVDPDAEGVLDFAG